MQKIIAALARLLRRLETLAVGTVEDAMSPLTRIRDELKAIEQRASAAEAKARTEVFELLDYAEKHAQKVYAARAYVEKLEKLIG